ncbi:MAG TPA: hypothetical protein VGJ82_21860 [Thermoanaerobaculia bacterium]|jgi:hypothetical protein
MKQLTNHLAVILLALPFVTSTGAQAQRWVNGVSPIQATLVVPDTKVLPGVPFEMWVTVVNPSDASVGVGLCPSLLVKRDGGESFSVAGKRNGRYDEILSDAQNQRVSYVVLRPHEQRTLTLPIQSELIGASFFDDNRLLGPGTYALSLRLDFCWCGSCVPQEKLLPPEFLGPIMTNEVTIERSTPAGSDAAVWTRLQELAAHGTTIANVWHNYAFLNDVVSNHPDSNYVPYALLASSFGNNTPKYRERVRAAITRFPSTPVGELLQVHAWTPADAEWTNVQHSKRPTTRVTVFGREDASPQPCTPGHDCEQ